MKNLQEKKRLNVTNGDIWQVGKHKVACGDARDADLVKMLFGDEKIKSVICDVPYGVNYTESKKDLVDIKVTKAIANDNITNEIEYARFNEDWLNVIIPHLALKNAIYIFNSDKMIFALRESMRKVKVRFTQLLVWVKNQPVMGRMDYLPQHELIAYGWYGTHTFMRAKDKSVLFFPRPSKSPYHATQKPIALIKNLVLNSTRTGDVVYDGFLGSGTTTLACEETGRVCYGIELDAEHVATILHRFEMRYGIKAEKVYEIRRHQK